MAETERIVVPVFFVQRQRRRTGGIATGISWSSVFWRLRQRVVSAGDEWRRRQQWGREALRAIAYSDFARAGDGYQPRASAGGTHFPSGRMSITIRSVFLL